MNSQRILFVTQYHPFRYTGGAEVQCWMLARELAKRGWDVHYASEMNQVPEPGVFEGVMLHGLPEESKMPSFNRKAVRSLMEEVSPNVIYNRVFNFYTRDAILEAPRHAITVWAMAHDSDLNLSTQLIHMRSVLPISVFLKMLPSTLYVRHGAARGRQHAGLLLAQSLEQQDALREIGFGSTVLRNSHPPVSNDDVQDHSGEPSVLWVANLKAGKRPDLYLDLAQRCRDLSAPFVMIGNLYDEGYRPLVEETRKKNPAFHWLGFVKREEIGAHYSRAHLMISTSPAEGFPNTFIEAWMRGVPVVSLGVDPDGLLFGEGIGVCVSDEDELEDAVRGLLKDRERRREMGRRAREFARKEFNLSGNVDKLEALLTERGVKKV